MKLEGYSEPIHKDNLLEIHLMVICLSLSLPLSPLLSDISTR